ncbi:MAG: gas vesicle protein GvpO [Haloglomus sp.]
MTTQESPTETTDSKELDAAVETGMAPTDDGGATLDILDVRERVVTVADTLLDHPFDGMTTVEPTDDGGWRAVFEVVERSAVPDTQDVIGRYELRLSGRGEVEEYALQQRFKRSEMQGEGL